MSGVLSVMIALVGVVVTCRCGFVQRHLGKGIRCLLTAQKGEGVSATAALCTTLAATLGTGNIIGVATAVALGGPGALFWMVVSALIGMGIKYGECALAVRYRQATATGYRGGPYLYIERKMGRPFACLFALCGAVAGAVSIGTTLQMDSVLLVLDGGRNEGVSLLSLVICALTAVLAGLVLWGGKTGITRFCESVIPVMSVGYLLCCGVILFRFRSQLPTAVWLIVNSAFCPSAALGGTVGGVLRTVTAGVSRGILSNEAGLGSAPIASAAASEGDPCRQGLIAMFGVFADTVVMCLLTGLCIVVTGAWRSGGADSTALAFEMGLGRYGVLCLSLFLCFFAFTTIVGWYFFAGSCFEYLSEKNERYFRLFYIAMILLTPFINSERLWALSDLLCAGMALPNLTALLLYHKELALFRVPPPTEFANKFLFCGQALSKSDQKCKK